MTVLEQLLSRTDNNITINKSASETSQKKLIKAYRRASINCLIISVIPFVLIMSNPDMVSFPYFLKIYLLVFLLLASAWYLFLSNQTKKIEIFSMLPTELFSASSKLKIYTLTGEVFFAIALTVFFTLFLPNLWAVSRLSFWLTLSCLICGLVFTLALYIPKLTRLFQGLESIK